MLQDEADTKGGQQGFQRAALEELDYAALDDDAGGGRHQEAGGNRENQCQARLARQQLLHAPGGVGTQHDQLAVSHVDDAHHAEGDGQADGGQDQHGTQAEAKIERFGGAVEFQFLFDGSQGLLGLVGQGRVVAAHGFVQGSSGSGVKTAGQYVHGLKITLTHSVNGQCLFNATAHRGVLFPFQLRLQRLDQGSVHFAHHVLCGGFTHVRVCGVQVQHGENTLKLAPYPVIDGDSVQLAAGHFAHVLSGQRVGDFPVPAPVVQYDHDLAGVVYPAQAVVAISFEPAPGSFITAADDGIDGLFNAAGGRFCKVIQQGRSGVVFLGGGRKREHGNQGDKHQCERSKDAHDGVLSVESELRGRQPGQHRRSRLSVLRCWLLCLIRLLQPPFLQRRRRTCRLQC